MRPVQDHEDDQLPAATAANNGRTSSGGLLAPFLGQHGTTVQFCDNCCAETDKACALILEVSAFLFICFFGSALLWRYWAAWFWYRNAYSVKIDPEVREWRSHVYSYNNAQWSTLSDVLVNGRGQESQYSFIALPVSGSWQLAPSCTDAEYVVASHTFNTKCAVLADGSARNTQQPPMNPNPWQGLLSSYTFLQNALANAASGLFGAMTTSSYYYNQLQSHTQDGMVYYAPRNDKCYFEQVLIVQCAEGYRFVEDAETSPCAPCEAGTFSNTHNAKTCTACPFGKTSRASSSVCSDNVPASFLSTQRYPDGQPLLPNANIGNVNLPKNYYLSFEILPLSAMPHEASILQLKDSRVIDDSSPQSHLPSLSFLAGGLRLRAVGFYGGMTAPVELLFDDALKLGVWQRVWVSVSTAMLTGSTSLTVGAVVANSLAVQVAPKAATIVWSSTVGSFMSSSVLSDVQIFASSPTLGVSSANATIRDLVICASEAKCKCAPGQFLSVPQFSCTPCNVGKYFPAQGGSQSACLSCGPQTYAPRRGATACLACPVNSRAYGGAASCLCEPGRYRSNSTCIACPRNAFSGFVDQSACSACPADSSSDSGAATCRCADGYGTLGDGSSLQCVACRPGEASTAAVRPSNATADERPRMQQSSRASPGCSRCPAGKFSASDKSLECSPCAGNTVSANSTGSTSCVPCPANSEPGSADPSECTCLPGYFRPLWVASSKDPRACRALSLFGLRPPDLVLSSCLAATLLCFAGLLIKRCCCRGWRWDRSYETIPDTDASLELARRESDGGKAEPIGGSTHFQRLATASL